MENAADQRAAKVKCAQGKQNAACAHRLASCTCPNCSDIDADSSDEDDEDDSDEDDEDAKCVGRTSSLCLRPAAVGLCIQRYCMAHLLPNSSQQQMHTVLHNDV